MRNVLAMVFAAVLAGSMLVLGGCGSGGDAGVAGGISSVALDGSGTVDTPAALTAAVGSIFTDNVATANNVVITGFGADNKIVITGASSSQYDTSISSTASGDVIIAYNSGTALNRIELKGVVPSGFVFDVASFNALAVGNIEFQ